MLNLTRLLCGAPSEGDPLRYGRAVGHARSAFRPQPHVHHRPVVVWTATRRCNLHCAHCYADSHDRAYPGELSTAEARALIADLAAYGVPVLLLSGGEPLRRPDLAELVAYATSLGLRTVLSTNGTLLDPPAVRRLAQAGLAYVGVSLDGPPHVHDHFRGAKGAFDAAVRGIEGCLAQGLKVGVRFTLTRRNAKHLPWLLRFVEERGIPRLCVYHLVYSGRGARIPRFDLDARERRRAVGLLFEATVDLYRRRRSIEVLTVDNHADAAFLLLWAAEHVPQRLPEIERLLRANGGNSSGVGIGCVDNLGDVHPDQFWQHYTVGNIRERPFSAIWEDTADPVLAGLRQRRPRLPSRCQACRFLDVCNGNLRVRAEAATGDLWGPDPACYLPDDAIRAPAAAGAR